MSENLRKVYRVVVTIAKTYDLLVEASSEKEAENAGIAKAITTQQIPKNAKTKCVSVTVEDGINNIPDQQMPLRHPYER